jgi:8-oxo-dGTP pyrophosphatase MutT (NUDIX family)
MNLKQAIDLYAVGNENSGCNPKAAEEHGAKCGRPAKGEKRLRTETLKSVKSQPLPESWDEAEENPYHDRSYGVVIMNDDGNFLLRSPTGFFDGYHWTFPKGKMDSEEEHPADVALRELKEETGHRGGIVEPIEGTFKSGMTTTNNYYLAKSEGFNEKDMDEETFALRWVPYWKARELIKETTNKRGRERDLAVLDAAWKAFQKRTGGTGNPMAPKPPGFSRPKGFKMTPKKSAAPSESGKIIDWIKKTFKVKQK